MSLITKHLTLISLVLSITGCTHIDTPKPMSAEQLQAEQEAAAEKAKEEKLRQDEKDLRRAGILVENNNTVQARELLTPLLSSERFAARAQVLLDRVTYLEEKKLIENNQRESTSQSLLEVEERLTLPETYGQALTISPDMESFTLPPGPMEKLVNQKVSMHLDNADIKTIVMELSKIDGLNLIADKALTSKSSLTLHVDNVPLAEIFSYISRNMGIAFHVSENVIWITAANPKTPKGPQLETRIFKLKGGLIPSLNFTAGMGVGGDIGLQKNMPKPEVDKELEEALKTFLNDSPPGATYRIFPKRNILIARNSREKLLLIQDFLDSLDTPPLQVLIESRFITMSQEDFFELGFNLQNLILPKSGESISFDDLKNRNIETGTVTAKGEDYKKFYSDAQITELLEPNPGLSERRMELAGNLPGNVTLSGILGNVVYQATLDAIKRVGSSRTLSAPRITVTNNEPAYIFRGTKRYYFEKYDLETVDQGDFGSTSKVVPVGTPKELPVGLFLFVKPSIGNDQQTLVLALKPEIKDFTGFEPFSEDGLVKLPIVNESSLATTVVLNSGETVVLGGMLTNTNAQTVTKVPLLGDIPILGFFFRKRTTTSKPEHLLIFVTATIIGHQGHFIHTVSQTAATE